MSFFLLFHYHGDEGYFSSFDPSLDSSGLALVTEMCRVSVPRVLLATSIIVNVCSFLCYFLKLLILLSAYGAHYRLCLLSQVSILGM